MLCLDPRSLYLLANPAHQLPCPQGWDQIITRFMYSNATCELNDGNDFPQLGDWVNWGIECVYICKKNESTGVWDRDWTVNMLKPALPKCGQNLPSTTRHQPSSTHLTTTSFKVASGRGKQTPLANRRLYGYQVCPFKMISTWEICCWECLSHLVSIDIHLSFMMIDNMWTR